MDLKIRGLLPVLLILSGATAHAGETEQDKQGREVVRGPVYGGYHSNVHIISDSVGVDASYMTTDVVNSVIEAPICISSEGSNLTVRNNVLLCDLCVEITGNMIMNTRLESNQCSGRGTNRPDVFGW